MRRRWHAAWVLGVLAAAVLVAISLGSIVPTDLGAGDDRSLDDGTIGVVDGVRYDDAIAVTGADGLNASERSAMTTRAMARLERLRGLDFGERVNLTLVSRTEYRENYSTAFESTEDAWNDQVWEGLFLVGEDRSVSDVFNDTYGNVVLGYYEPGTGNIVLVSDSETPQIARRTLVHELVHGLQDQAFGLDGQPDTQDRQLARNAVVEGEAERLATRYEQRCEGEWDCVDVGSSTGGGSTESNGAYQDRVFQVIYHPYAAGPGFVSTVADRGGTEALDRLYDPYPESTEQIIHPDAYPDETPVNVTVPDRSSADWDRFDHDPVADTVGEASIYVMADVHDLGEGQGGPYSYQNTVSAGWGGDTLVPYRTAGAADGDGGQDDGRVDDGDDGQNDSTGATEYGYVWETAWDSPSDATQFHDAYLAMLDQYDAETVREGVYRLPAGSGFSGAYRVTRDGTTVRVVHGPTRASLSEIHAP